MVISDTWFDRNIRQSVVYYLSERLLSAICGRSDKSFHSQKYQVVASFLGIEFSIWQARFAQAVQISVEILEVRDRKELRQSNDCQLRVKLQRLLYRRLCLI